MPSGPSPGLLAGGGLSSECRWPLDFEPGSGFAAGV